MGRGVRSLKHHMLIGIAMGALTIPPTQADAAPGSAIRVDIRAGTLGDALSELAHENNVEILFRDDLVQGKKTRAVKGRMTAQQVLTHLLAGTDLSYRSAPGGPFVIYQAPQPPSPDPGDGAVSELLVIGRRTQNADIRRSENDIQPYKIAGQRELAVAPQDNVDQYFRDRLPANGQTISPSQYVVSGGSNASAIDLRGVGTQRTLVLIDGRRLPGLPTQSAGFDQPDINAIPLGAIDRIETLTATAGGIHGPTAIGGVVNLVLKRDYRGADFVLASGISSRGDATRARMEFRVGFTPDDGRTDVMLSGSYAAARPFTVGQRDYASRSLRQQATANPIGYQASPLPLNAIIIRSYGGEPLQLDPSLGGAVLNSNFTYLPIDFKGTDQERAAVMLANSGKLVTDPGPGLSGAGDTLLATPKSFSALLNVRRRLSDRLELFVDGLYLSNDGKASVPGYYSPTWTHGDAGGNLFANTVLFNVPIPAMVMNSRTRTDTHRITAGLIARLPGRWQVLADSAIGGARLRTDRDYLSEDNIDLHGKDSLYLALWYGAPNPGGKPAVVPLSDYTALQSAIGAYLVPSTSPQRFSTTFSDVSVRAAGPLMSLPGGPLTLTLLGELRHEHIPQTQQYSLIDGLASTSPSFYRTQNVRSGYVELRAPLTSQNSFLWFARRLELQLAVRQDRLSTIIPKNILPAAQTSELITLRHRANVFTLGARAFPTQWLMVRASVATGETPPDLRYLQERVIPLSDGITDPKRGGRTVGSEAPVVEARSGSHKLGQEKGRTTSAGVVLNPSGRGPRISVDYSRVEIRDEISAIRVKVQSIVNAEALYPEYVERAPLTASDAALGYTAGPITKVYSGYGNIGRTTVETVDFQFDWDLPPVLWGETQLHGAATWQPVLRSKLKRDTPWLDRTGYRDSPLEWRGEAGVQWSRGPLTIDLTAQYLGGYNLYYSPFSIQAGTKTSDFERVSSQTYLDLVALRRFKMTTTSALRTLDVRLSIQNLLDRSPPIVADPLHMGYDYRGDPRRRRFELLLSAKF